MLDNTYYIKCDNLTEALNKAEKIEDSLKKFKSKHEGCEYTTSINNIDEQWEVEINIKNKNERDDKEAASH